ncbi:protein IMPAIRED IN BABA-INDUCED STERILITY 1 [Sesamum alatum]|uniref:Protein IMPAIRED IN BABA-INDUCED STERILITY 1 n=1 Tax=Sesamum alatum TaxID=300844 RepID=A0AAE2CCZ4_9LAMI|nr:protein IMPAIRED IN BABA-INDUCED STERILITY 1 [Sesamum alatum]
MGCVSSKKARTQSPAFDDVVSTSSGRSSRPGRLASSRSVHVEAALEKIKEEPERETIVDEELRQNGQNVVVVDHDDDDLRAVKRAASQRKTVFSFKFGRLAEAEHVTAGWPAWLTAVAGDAIEGWEPLKSEAFERLEKIGQGTYSTVYRARELKTGKMVAVKKVRFDNFQPESVRFMAREILILRKLDHPNIMKLQGIITSRLSCSIYLVFEYMEHDLAGLLSCPDIKFTDSQIKCYMQQLLSAVDHCHSRGIMHRDIKSSNILVNNEGILKIADFGLANFTRPTNKQPLTSRVVTLWYRPPELLLGSTNYAESVDLWSVGCVFAELFIGRPLLKARTEVEQLHKIFKLCGSPPDDYWKRSKLPLAAMFKPQQPYESTLRERCKELPKGAVSLIETFLAIEPHKRGTAAAALESEYFTTKPCPCDPSSMPKYPPNKEIDAKNREEARRKKSSTMARAEVGPRYPRRVRKTLHESSDFSKVIPAEEVEANAQVARKNHGVSTNAYRKRGGVETRTSLKQSYDTKSDASQGSQTTQASQATSVHSLPAQVTTSSSFAWAKRRKQPDVFTRLHSQPTQSSNQKSIALEPSNLLHAHDTLEPDGQQNQDSSGRISGAETAKRPTRRELRRPESFDSADIYDPQDFPEDYGNKKKGRVAYSGTLSSQELAARQHDQPRQVHRSRFYID